MQEKYGSHFSDPIDFSLSDAQNSYITYRQKRLYYTKFSKATFSMLAEQYRDFTGQELIINFNGLTLSPELQIEKIIETVEQEKVFEYFLNRSFCSSITITHQQRLPFNQIVFKIIKSQMFIQDNSIHQPPKIKQSKHSSQFENLKKLQKHQLQYALGQKQAVQNTNSLVNKNMFEQINNTGQNRQKQLNKLMIYWVDDEPKNNTEIIENYFRTPFIEVKQVVSTKDMINLLQQEYKSRRQNGFKILFISDMTRMEQNYLNYEAGIDLFEELYHKRQLTDLGIAFVNNIEGTAFNMQKRNLKRTYIKIINRTADLVAAVLYYAPKQK